MKTLSLYKFAKTGDIESEPLTIEIHETIPEIYEPHSLEQAVGIYETQAQALAQALFTTLPGGTLDRLLLALMEKKVSYFRVGYVK